MKKEVKSKARKTEKKEAKKRVKEQQKLIQKCKKKEVKLATVVEGHLKVPFSIATTPRCRGGHYSFP